MADYDNNTTLWGARAGARAAERDAGLRAHMLGVYNIMGMGLALSGLSAWVTANFFAPVFFTQVAPGAFAPNMLGLIAMFAPLAFVLVLSFGVNRMSSSTAYATFLVYATVMGVSLASILLNFTSESVARVFFITAATFGAMSLWGYTTKADLSKMGSFLLMGLIGIIIASLVNIFLASSMLQFVISVIGVIIFTGLTAYDTQRIKEEYYYGYDAETGRKAAIMGALSLYLNFINLFMLLMQLLGQRNDE